MGWVDAVIPVIIALIAPIPTSNSNYLPLEPAPDLIYFHPSYSLRLSTARSLLSRIHRCTKIGNRIHGYLPIHSTFVITNLPPPPPPFLDTYRFHARFLQKIIIVSSCIINSLAHSSANDGITSTFAGTNIFPPTCALVFEPNNRPCNNNALPGSRVARNKLR